MDFDQGWNMLGGALIGCAVGAVTGGTAAARFGPWWATPLGGVGGGMIGFWVGGLAGMLR